MDRLEKHFAPVAGKALERFGFAYGELIANWASIVGETLAQGSSPERVRWPRGNEGTGGRGRGGTLVIAVESGLAIEVQHEAPRIVERINGYYGYEAISTLKIQQTHVKSHNAAPPDRRQVPAAEVERLSRDLKDIADEPLKAALGRLGRGVLAAKKD